MKKSITCILESSEHQRTVKQYLKEEVKFNEHYQRKVVELWKEVFEQEVDPDDVIFTDYNELIDDLLTTGYYGTAYELGETIDMNWGGLAEAYGL